MEHTLKMRNLIQKMLLAFVMISLHGCLLLNNVIPIPNDKVTMPSDDRAIAIYGVALESDWPYPQFSISLDEYSMEKQAITGNCWRFNRMNATVPKTRTSVQYFAFEVAPGYYTFSPFNAQNQNTNQAQAFHLPAGQISYIGDFIYVGQQSTDLRRNHSAIESNLKKIYPNIKSTIKLAEYVMVARPFLFLCAP
jgi:hypothetical protein